MTDGPEIQQKLQNLRRIVARPPMSLCVPAFRPLGLSDIRSWEGHERSKSRPRRARGRPALIGANIIEAHLDPLTWSRFEERVESKRTLPRFSRPITPAGKQVSEHPLPIVFSRLSYLFAVIPTATSAG